MTDTRKRSGRARPIGELVGRLVAPALRRRGFATADLMTHWPDLVGPRYCGLTRPEKLHWPRGSGTDPDAEHRPATLSMACDPGAALFVQHELDQIRERINAYFGYTVVGRIKLVQKSFETEAGEGPPPDSAELSPDQLRRLRASTGSVDDDGLRAALDRLGRGVMSQTSRKPDDQVP